MIDTLRERHLLPMVAPAAILTRVCRVDLDELGASFCRFAFQLREKGRPGRVTDAFRQTMVMEHSIDMQDLDANYAVGIDDLTAFLMREVFSTERDTLMHPRYRLTMLAPLR